MVYFLFVVGFIILIKGADWLVVGSASIAKKFNVSDVVIGLTIVSMGTSMPELIVNVIGSLEGSSDLVVGNVVGSNISNILLILGVSALIFPLVVNEKTVLSEIPYSIVAVLLVAFVANATFFSFDGEMQISRIDGIILLFFFVLFISYILKLIKQGRIDATADNPDTLVPIPRSVVYVVVGMICLFFGGQWVVNGAKEMARMYGLSEKMIGLTVVAIGTSMPELVTSAVAAFKKNTNIAVANVIGSNIFNLLWVLGVSSAISPVSFSSALNADIFVLLGASCLIILALVVGKRNSIDRFNGVVFVVLYVAYMFFVVNRG